MIYCYAEIKKSTAFFTRGVDYRPKGRVINTIELEGFIVDLPRKEGGRVTLGKERSRVWIKLEFDSLGTGQYSDAFNQPSYSDDCIGEFCVSDFLQGTEIVNATLNAALPADQFLVLWGMRSNQLKVFCHLCENEDNTLAIKVHEDKRQTLYIKNINFETDA